MPGAADRPMWIATLAGLLEGMTPIAEAGGLPLSLDMASSSMAMTSRVER